MNEKSARVNSLRMNAAAPPQAPDDSRIDALSSLLDHLDDRTSPALDSPKPTGWEFENRLVQARLGMASSLFAALRARHAPTAAHCLRVSVGCSAWMACLEMTDGQRDEIEVAALLHDIGKIGVPDSVLKKPAPLTLEERNVMARHRRMGLDILRHCAVSSELLDVLRFSSAWYDGSRTGFDRREEQLPFGARLISIVDAFDSMTTDQIYRPALSRERAVAELYRHAGTQFSPDLVERFCRLVMADAVDLNAAVSKRWLRRLTPQLSDQMWRLQTLDTFEQESPGELFHEKLLQSMHDGVVFVDISGTILYWNRAAERLTGLPMETVVDRQWDPGLIALRDDQDRELTHDECPLLESLKTRVQTLRRMSIQGRGEDCRRVDAHFVPVIGRDGTIHGAALVLHDATSEVSLEERVRTLHTRATQDPLTKVANRAEFDRLHAQFVESHLGRARPCALIISDIDYFKRINDQYGHQAGDEALVSFAALLKRFCRPGDVVARYGGEEFVLLCADCDNVTATARAEEIRIELSETPQTMLNDKCITSSFGVTELQDGDTPETMLRRADRALLQAKETGRNRVVQLGAGLDGGDKPEFHRGWFSWFDNSPAGQIADQKLVTLVPFDVAVEKLKGFIADHAAELVSVDDGQLVIKIEADKSKSQRRKADRAVPFLIEITFEEEEKDANLRSRGTRIDVVVRPIRSRDRRKVDLAERANQLLSSLKSYLMATEYVAPSSHAE